MAGRSPSPVIVPRPITFDKPIQTRSRSGCLTCRQRRLKCDETTPACNTCSALGRTCRWGLKASFHGSRMLCLSSEESAAIAAVEASRPVRRPFEIVDNTREILDHYTTGDQGESPHSGDSPSPAKRRQSAIDHQTALFSTEPEDLERLDYILLGNNPPSWIAGNSDMRSATVEGSSVSEPDAETVVTFTEPLSSDGSSAELPTVDLRGSIPEFTSTLSSALEFLAPGPLALPPQIGGVSPPVDETMKAKLLLEYMNETSTWCETTDTQRHFSLVSAASLIEPGPLNAAALALASRQLDVTTSHPHSLTLELYQYAIGLLIGRVQIDLDYTILASCVLLCVYEMMTSHVSEWRRHLRGCAGLFRLKDWNGSSAGFLGACFWPFARIDIWAAFLTGQKTLVPTDTWVTPDYLEMSDIPIDDRYANLAILTFARIVNLLSDIHIAMAGDDEEEEVTFLQLESNNSNGSSATNTLKTLWMELQRWRGDCPRSILPLMTVDNRPDTQFPTVLCSGSSASESTTDVRILELSTLGIWKGLEADFLGSLRKYLLSHWLYLTIAFRVATKYWEPGQRALEPVMARTDDMWHIRDNKGPVRNFPPFLLSSSLHSRRNHSHPHDSANWVNNLQPLYVAGQYISAPGEQIALMRHLKQIERSTGWKTSERSRDLRKMWELE